MSSNLHTTGLSDLDPLEKIDLEEDLDEDDGEIKEEVDDLGEETDHLINPDHLSGSASGVSSDLPPEIEEEIKKVIIPEHEIVASGGKPKNNSHLLPLDLVNTPLDPAKDLWDEDSGSI